MKAFFTSFIFALSLYAGMREAQAAGCGKVSIAQMRWSSAGIAANFDKFILEKGYGCSVTIVNGDTLPTFTSMNTSGTPDIASEFWVKGFKPQLDDAIKAGRLVEGAEILADGAIEGWYIPKFIADANPDIGSVQDALRHPELFPDTYNPSRAAVYNCPESWACEISTRNLFRALNADKLGFALIDSRTPDDFDASIARAFDNKVGWIGYYWSPTSVIGKYDMKLLNFGVPHDQVEWDACTSVRGCPNPKVNAYPVSQAFTLITRSFADRAGPVMNYLKARSWDNETISQVLAWQDENGEDNENAAHYFLENYEELWSHWVPADVAEKVKASL
ncbi:glycine betaine/proline transport system substrate-binding protein [Rhizobium sp. BK650]|uniref:glycine betaine ABC transporter substrate-binding protein n=1 Tax=Rhizobium sp. BK650 TaxID=2586990 RepID=UPI0016098082|nr:glycine betaine ABC transporter substrate-binding protein [Rhizobium sp. BK650]MBB3655502.1 glycine betaine/proline transport system substrate-binding protein [Rhizobium sp. BK650]